MKSEKVEAHVSPSLKDRLRERRQSKFVRQAVRQRLDQIEAAEEVLEDWSRTELRSLMGTDLDLTQPLGPQIAGAMSGERPKGVPPDEWENRIEEVLDREEVALAVWTFCATAQSARSEP